MARKPKTITIVGDRIVSKARGSTQPSSQDVEIADASRFNLRAPNVVIPSIDSIAYYVMRKNKLTAFPIHLKFVKPVFQFAAAIGIAKPKYKIDVCEFIVQIIASTRRWKRVKGKSGLNYFLLAPKYRQAYDLGNVIYELLLKEKVFYDARLYEDNFRPKDRSVKTSPTEGVNQ